MGTLCSASTPVGVPSNSPGERTRMRFSSKTRSTMSERSTSVARCVMTRSSITRRRSTSRLPRTLPAVFARRPPRPGRGRYCIQPVDAELLMLKLGTFIRARREAEGARSRALVDQFTGLYSEYGLQQWGEQLGARALRKREAMACVVVMPTTSNGEAAAYTPEQSSDALAEITDVCRSQSRRSDVVGYLGDSRVAILAPDTDAPGVVRLIERLQAALGEASAKSRSGRKTATLRAGYCVVPNLAVANLGPNELVRRAETALQRAHDSSGREVVVSFDDALIS